MRPEKENVQKYKEPKKDYDEKYEEDYCVDECDYEEYDKKYCGCNYNKKQEKKLIQTKVIKGKGSEDFFLEADFTIPDTTGQGPLYLIESVTTWVDVYDAKVVCDNKVIFNAWVYENIIYKVFDDATSEEGGVTVTGPVAQVTKSVPLAGCINIDTKHCGKLNPCEDIVEVLNAKVVGGVEDKLGEQEEFDSENNPFNPPIYTYGRIHEKMCIKIEVKVVRWEHVAVETEEKC